MCLCSCIGLYICVDCALDYKKRYCSDHLLGQKFFFFFTFCANSCPLLGFSVLCLLHELASDILYKFFGMVCWFWVLGSSVLGMDHTNVLGTQGVDPHKCVVEIRAQRCPRVGDCMVGACHGSHLHIIMIEKNQLDRN